jgi:hypothetical protein
MKLRPATKSPVRVSGPVEGVWGNREVPPERPWIGQQIEGEHL